MTDEERKKCDEYVAEFVHTTTLALDDILKRENGIVNYIELSDNPKTFFVMFARIIQAATVNWLINLKINMENHIELKEYANRFMEAAIKDIADAYHININNADVIAMTCSDQKGDD